MSRRKLRWAVALAGMVAGVLLPQSAVSAAPLVDQTIAGPIGGAELCVAGVCQEVQGARDVHVVVDVNPGAVTPPAVFTGTAPGCTANINLAVFATSPGIGGSVVTPLVEYTPTDKNGNPTGPPQALVQGPIHLTPVPGVTVPVASVCARVL